MKKVILVATLLMVTVNIWAQQTIKSENVGSFTSIVLSGNMQVELIAAQENGVNVVLTDVDINKFKWSVNKGVLRMDLDVKPGKVGSAYAKIYYSDTLQDISITSCELTANDTIKGHIVKMSLYSNAKVVATLEVDELEMSAVSNSAAQISGKTKYMSLRAAEKSVINSQKMANVSAEVDTATGAEVHMRAYERLVGNARSSSTIFYLGKPLIFKDLTSKMSSGMMGSSILNVGE